MDLLSLLQSSPPPGLPISGFALCFIPLLTVILGFIVAARFTDRRATSTYLRILPQADGSSSATLAAAPFMPAAPAPVPAAKPLVDDSASISNVARGVSVPPAPAAPSSADMKATLSGATPASEPLRKSEPEVPPAAAMADIAPAAATPIMGDVGPAEPMLAAAATGLGISYIEFDPPGRDIDGEYVLVRNSTGSEVDMTGWKLSDGGANHTFNFPAFTLAAGAEVKIWSKSGANDAGNLYWGWRSAIWNNTGDTAKLFDASGAVVNSYSYEGNAEA